jgi:hypothetical protein
MTAEARSTVDAERAEESKEVATTSTFTLPEGLFTAAAGKFEQAHPGQRATSQRVIDFALDQHLDDIRNTLLRLGFRNRPLGSPKPRRISKRALAALKLASSESGISAAAILRACLEATR